MTADQRATFPPQTSDSRLTELRGRFQTINDSMAIQMQIRGGSASIFPAGDIPDVDITVIATSPDGTERLTFESSGIWTKRGEGKRVPISKAARATPMIIVEEYAVVIRDPEYLKAVAEIAATGALQRAADGSLSVEDRRRIYTNEIEPRLNQYFDINEERLMEELSREMTEAFGRVVNAGFHLGERNAT